MIIYNSIQKLADEAQKKGKRISDIVLEDQARQLGRSEEDLYLEMQGYLKVMLDSIKKGLKSEKKSASGLSGGDASKMKKANEEKKVIGGDFIGSILVKALAVAEVNACMGKIVAAPTAGSCGIIPATLAALMEELDIPEDRVVMSLFTSAGIGMVIAENACISGANGGCMAECGSASAMAAAAMVELAGGTPIMSAHACAIALKNVLGLVCDPVAGLVEIPCIKRNASGAANALVAANLALAGIESRIPADEVIDAMKAVGEAIPTSLKETADGGLAATPTAKKLSTELS